MSKNILQALGKIDTALGGNTDDAANVIDALDQISERAGSLKNSVDNINSMELKVCESGEYDVETGVPTIEDPVKGTFYLTPAKNEEDNNIFNEYYVNDDGQWEMFGSASINVNDLFDLSDRMAKGVNDNGTIVYGAIIEGTLSGSYKNKASGINSHAEGRGATASGINSHAEGNSTIASGDYSHAEGGGTTASGHMSHAEGYGTTASGSQSHAEGYGTTASNYQSHAEGYGTTASGDCSHTEGSNTTASGNMSHAEGSNTTASGNSSHAEGQSYNFSSKTIGGQTYARAGAYGESSHSEGQNNLAINNSSHAEGNNTIASGSQSHAEGNNTIAFGSQSHAEGNGTIASGYQSHAEGYGGTFKINNVSYTSEAKGTADHTEGCQTRTAIGGQPGNHAEGYQTAAIGGASHAEGMNTTASGSLSHAEGNGTIASGNQSHAEGQSTIASDVQSHAEGFYTIASGASSHASGFYTVASGAGSHTEGNYINSLTSMKITGSKNTLVYTYDKMVSSNIEKNKKYFINNNLVTVTELNTVNKTITIDKTLNENNDWTNYQVTVIEPAIASGPNSHAEGQYTIASGSNSHAEGMNTIASGYQSHAEGYGGTYTIDNVSYTAEAKGMTDHTEGYQTRTASGGQPGNHAEGYQTAAIGGASHAEGMNTIASGYQSHAEGQSTTASGPISHAEGVNTTASGSGSHAEGNRTIANHAFQHVFGEFNIEDSSSEPVYKKGTYIEIVGNGTENATRSNARTLDWSGNETLLGSLTLGKGTADEVTITATQLKALLATLPS